MAWINDCKLWIVSGLDNFLLLQYLLLVLQEQLHGGLGVLYRGVPALLDDLPQMVECQSLQGQSLTPGTVRVGVRNIDHLLEPCPLLEPAHGEIFVHGVPDHYLVEHFAFYLGDHVVFVGRILYVGVRDAGDLGHKIRDLLGGPDIGVVDFLPVFIDEGNPGEAFLLPRFHKLTVYCHKLVVMFILVILAFGYALIVIIIAIVIVRLLIICLLEELFPVC